MSSVRIGRMCEKRGFHEPHLLFLIAFFHALQAFANQWRVITSLFERSPLTRSSRLKEGISGFPARVK